MSIYKGLHLCETLCQSEEFGQRSSETLVSQQYNTARMNVLVIIKFAFMLAIVASTASAFFFNRGNYNSENGFQRVYNGIEAADNNAGCQHGLNKYAEGVGAGTGTAKLYGVLGTGRYFGYGHNRIHDEDNHGYS